MAAGLPPPPPGCSPTLGVRRTAGVRERGPMLAGVFAVFAAVAVWEHARGDVAWYWAASFFGVGYLLVAAAIVRGEVSSGADWLRRTAPLGSAWVRTSDLVEATVETSLTGSRVTLKDAQGRQVNARLEELAEAPEVWRPLSSALRASLAAGRLNADATARRALGLGEPPDLQKRQH